MGAAVVLAPGAAVGAEGWQLGNSLGGGVGSGRTLATAAAAAIVIGPSASLSSDPTVPPLSAMLVGPCLADWLTPDGLYRCGWATAPHENQAAAIVVAVAAGWGPSTPLSPPRFSAAQRSNVCVFLSSCRMNLCWNNSNCALSSSETRSVSETLISCIRRKLPRFGRTTQHRMAGLLSNSRCTVDVSCLHTQFNCHSIGPLTA